MYGYIKYSLFVQRLCTITSLFEGFKPYSTSTRRKACKIALQIYLDNKLCELLGCQFLSKGCIIHCCYESVKFGGPHCDKDCAVRHCLWKWEGQIVEQHFSGTDFGNFAGLDRFGLGALHFLPAGGYHRDTCMLTLLNCIQTCTYSREIAQSPFLHSCTISRDSER